MTKSVSLHICVVPWYLSRRDLSMGKRTQPQGRGKPTYFKYSSRIQKISRDKGSLAASDLYERRWRKSGHQSPATNMKFTVASLSLAAGRVSHVPCIGHDTGLSFITPPFVLNGAGHPGSLLVHDAEDGRGSAVQHCCGEYSIFTAPSPSTASPRNTGYVPNHTTWSIKHYTGWCSRDLGKEDRAFTERREKCYLSLQG